MPGRACGCPRLFRCRVSDDGQDRGVGVGGKHDAGMAEHVLHDAEVHAGGQCERGRALSLGRAAGSVAARPGRLGALKVRVSRSGAIGPPSRLVRTYLLLRQAPPAVAASASCRSRGGSQRRNGRAVQGDHAELRGWQSRADGMVAGGVRGGQVMERSVQYMSSRGLAPAIHWRRYGRAGLWPASRGVPPRAP